MKDEPKLYANLTMEQCLALDHVESTILSALRDGVKLHDLKDTLDFVYKTYLLELEREQRKKTLKKMNKH